MKNNTSKPKKPTIDKDNFINFLASATPEEVNRYILEKGKPRKLVSPLYYFGDSKKENSSNK